jgi:SAM-dependent methyltransferase
VPETGAGQDHFAELDLPRYEASVGAFRKRSYPGFIARVSRHASGGRWLDVGCSFGWLLRFLADHTAFEPTGIEPSETAAAAARASGLHVVSGTFPDEALGSFGPFEVVSFLDVLEHLENPAAVLDGARTLLAPGGVVVIQVPDQACVLYQAAKVLFRASGGRLGFALKRLWLTELDFPHRYYFARRSLLPLLDRCGFDVLDWYRSPIGEPGQSADRVGYLAGSESLAPPIVAIGVSVITAIDAATGHGGLLTAIARPRRQTPSRARTAG